MATKNYISDNQTQMINVNDITVEESKRLRSTGDITPIKNSIETLGFLINPITIDTNNNLIAGYHRFLAYKELGKTEIPARIVDKNINKELIEIDENLIRNSLTTLETAHNLKSGKKYTKPYIQKAQSRILNEIISLRYIRQRALLKMCLKEWINLNVGYNHI